MINRTFLMVLCVRISSSVFLGLFNELSYREIDFELSNILENYLKDWHFLTESSTYFDLAEPYSKKTFIKKGLIKSENNKRILNDEVIKTPSLFSEKKRPNSKNEFSANISKTFNTDENFQTQKVVHEVRSDSKRNRSINIKSVKPYTPREKMSSTIGGKGSFNTPREKMVDSLSDKKSPSTQVEKRASTSRVRRTPSTLAKIWASSTPTRNRASNTPTRIKSPNTLKRSRTHATNRLKRSSNVPVIYMPGDKTTRKCAQVSGILAGFNTFNYLTFVNGVITLILNVNNNINNNNDNNNINNNNALTNNNIDLNQNTQTANQVVIFPPGRRKRSISDLLLDYFQGTAKLRTLKTMINSTNFSHLREQTKSSMKTDTVKGQSETSDSGRCWGPEAALAGLRSVSLWFQASDIIDLSDDCDWAGYCHLLSNTSTSTVQDLVQKAVMRISRRLEPERLSKSRCALLTSRCNI